MRLVLLVVLALSLQAQEPTQGGVWLMSGLIAHHKWEKPHNPANPLTDDDVKRAVTFNGFLSGVWMTLMDVKNRATNEYIRHMEIRDKAKSSGDVGTEQWAKARLWIIAETAMEFDPPSDVSVLQLRAVVENYLNKHPERWGDGEVVIIRNAIIEAFPPKK